MNGKDKKVFISFDFDNDKGKGMRKFKAHFYAVIFAFAASTVCGCEESPLEIKASNKCILAAGNPDSGAVQRAAYNRCMTEGGFPRP